MKMTMARRDIKAIEKGMEKFSTDSKGFLEIVNGLVNDNKSDAGTMQYDLLLHLQKCAKTYVEWGM